MPHWPRSFQIVALLLTCFILMPSPAVQSSASPATAEGTYWGQEPVETLTSRRSQIVLNGPWQFMPSVGQTPQSSAAAWGTIWVPGAWNNLHKAPGIIDQGHGAAWDKFDGAKLARAWYARSLHIPANWRGRAVLLDFDRISTDAVVYVNGQKCGRVNFPAGTVDITKAVQAGQTARLVVDVASTESAASADEILEASSDAVVTQSGAQEGRGILGDVVIFSRPQNAYINDLWVRPSTRRKELRLDIEWSGVQQASDVQLVAKLLNEKGVEEKRFTRTVRVSPGATQTTVQWHWPNPRLWDLAQPNLYTVKLEAKGAGLDDEYSQEFGFREFWIEGRQFFLNGTPFRMRPYYNIYDQYAAMGADRPLISQHIDTAMKQGFNIQEIWPSGTVIRGKYNGWPQWFDIADKKGWPLVGPMWSAMRYTIDFNGWKPIWSEENRTAWHSIMQSQMRRYRNHPSVLMWVLDANAYGHSLDQDPKNIGQTGYHDLNSWGYKNIIQPGLEAVRLVKAEDPTRPVIQHNGSWVGDIHTSNMYLNFIPLQEREEWLSYWAQHGTIPFMAIEFGMPLHCTFLRARAGYGENVISEPLLTEYFATYLGRRAYELETKGYRDEIVKHYEGEQRYANWHGNEHIERGPGMAELLSLFNRNTWRTWRTMGLSGGMIPWNFDGQLWNTPSPPAVTMPPFKPGTRGAYRDKYPGNLFHLYDREQGNFTPNKGGEALLANNGPTLAWIAGPRAAFTAKDHNFVAGQRVEKQVVIINDTRSAQPFNYSWRVVVAGKEVARGAEKGAAGVGTTSFFPIGFTVPTGGQALKQNGTVMLQATIGKASHQDSFSFRVFPKLTPARSSVLVFDPIGKTSTLLRSLGYTTQQWDGTASTQLLLIGREALSNGSKLPGNLDTFVRSGGRAVIFPQNPDWMRKQGWRVSRHVSRRVFPVENNPLTGDLDAEDLRDWNGQSTLLPEYYETPRVSDKDDGYPQWGWHWGNQGGVSSAALEKPHFGAWRPLLECEFDLAYSPLLELDYGKGRLIWNTLDLEEHAPIDPAAARMARQLISYAMRQPVQSQSRKTMLLGDDNGLLRSMGVVHQSTNFVNATADLVVIGSGAQVENAALTSYVRNGGRVLVLANAGASTLSSLSAGASLRNVNDFSGSLQVPRWSETAGLSVSDLHWRASHPTQLLTADANSGTQIGADGLLARRAIGKGVVILSRIDPNQFNADEKTYFRFTRWRQTRALAQVLANMGAAFESDSVVFRFAHDGAFAPYHPDYRSDYKLGDDPFRYYRW